MLGIPERDFARSVKVNNVGKNALADWIEGSLLFVSNEIAKSEIVDVLTAEQICPGDGQDLAFEIADTGWAEIGLRQRWIGEASQLVVSRTRITDVDDWRSVPGRSFLQMLSLMRMYPGWAEEHRDAVAQGELFERMIEEIAPGLFPGWDVYRAGWSPDNAVSIPNIVEALCPLLHVAGHPNLDEWVPDAAKDGGLDIVCYRSFPDEREALPVFFIQCASGTNWRSKVLTPNADEWQKYLDSAGKASTGIAAPFVIDEAEVRHAGLKGQIVVFDRLRLLYALHSCENGLSQELTDDLINWTEAMLDSIPKIN